MKVSSSLPSKLAEEEAPSCVVKGSVVNRVKQLQVTLTQSLLPTSSHIRHARVSSTRSCDSIASLVDSSTDNDSECESVVLHRMHQEKFKRFELESPSLPDDDSDVSGPWTALSSAMTTTETCIDYVKTMDLWDVDDDCRPWFQQHTLAATHSIPPCRSGRKLLCYSSIVRRILLCLTEPSSFIYSCRNVYDLAKCESVRASWLKRNGVKALIPHFIIDQNEQLKCPYTALSCLTIICASIRHRLLTKKLLTALENEGLSFMFNLDRIEPRSPCHALGPDLSFCNPLSIPHLTVSELAQWGNVEAVNIVYSLALFTGLNQFGHYVKESWKHGHFDAALFMLKQALHDATDRKSHPSHFSSLHSLFHSVPSLVSWIYNDIIPSDDPLPFMFLAEECSMTQWSHILSHVTRWSAFKIGSWLVQNGYWDITSEWVVDAWIEGLVDADACHFQKQSGPPRCANHSQPMENDRGCRFYNLKCLLEVLIHEGDFKFLYESDDILLKFMTHGRRDILEWFLDEGFIDHFTLKRLDDYTLS